MGGLDNDRDPLGLQLIHEQRSDLLGQTFLNLRPGGEGIHDAGEFGDADDDAVRQIGDVRLALEGHEVVLTERVESDVAEDDEFVVRFGERRGDQLRRILRQAGTEFGVHPGDTRRRLLQPLAVGILADADQNFSDGLLDAFEVHDLSVRGQPVGGRPRSG